MRAVVWSLVVVGLAGCSSEAGEDFLDHLGGERLPDGYLRYEAAPVELQPGQSAQYVHWVAPATDRDLDVVDVRGSQGVGGHHAILYASPDVETVGTVREWVADDQLTARFLGGTGGEGGAVDLPPGTVFRVPRGSGFYIQSHFLNATDGVVAGTSAIEVKLAEPSPDVTVLSMFVSSTLAIDVQPGAIEQTLDCTIQQDTPMILYVNHLHSAGVSITTDLHAADGSVRVVKDDPIWNYEWATRPNFDARPLAEPLMLTTGERLVTRCAWNNTTGARLGFPDEMCAFLGFYIGENDRACVNDTWLEL
jgi:hypothetical protein